MPSLSRACAALLGALAVAKALPASKLTAHDAPKSCPGPGLRHDSVKDLAMSQKTGPATETSSAARLGLTVSPTILASSRQDASSTVFVSQPIQPTTTARLHSGPLTVLPPAVHHDVDTKPASNVKPVPPGTPSTMFYSEPDPSVPGYFAFIHYYFIHHVVNIDHADHIIITGVEADELELSLQSDKALNLALDTWSVEKGLILVAYVQGCGDYEAAERCYFEVSGLEYDTSRGARTIKARGKARAPSGLISRGETTWGSRDGQSRHGIDASSKQHANTSFAWASHPPSAAPGPVLTSDSNLRVAPGLNQTAPLPRGSVRHRRSWYGNVWSAAEQVASRAFHADERAVSVHASLQTQYDRQLPSREEMLNHSTESPWGKAIRIASIGHNVDNKEGKAEARNAKKQQGQEKKEDQEVKSIHHEGDDQNAKDMNKLDDVLKGKNSPHHEAEAYVDIFCVDCGAKGHIQLSGSAQWTALEGFSQGRIDLHTRMVLSVKIGVDTRAKYSAELSHQLFQVGLPGLSYGFVTIGPQVSVGAIARIEAMAHGTLLAATGMSIRDARVVIDFVNGTDNDCSGWDPDFTRTLEATDELKVSASLGLSVGLECSIQVGPFNSGVKVIDEPSVNASAQIAAAMKLTQSGRVDAGIADTDGCHGISSQLSWRNRMYINIFKLKTISLFDTGYRRLARECIQ